jgi:hypothetical protein
VALLNRFEAVMLQRQPQIEIPGDLLRFFCQEDHALEFMSGSVRLGVLDHYRGLDDSRGDVTEGRSSVFFRADVPIHSTVTSSYHYYILCTTHPEVNVASMAKKYGQFMVRITRPRVLLERIKTAWEDHPLAQNAGAFISPVEYTKDEMREADGSFFSPPHLVYSQKRKIDETDREYRYLLKTKVDAKRKWEPHLTLVLPDCRDICSEITVCTTS